jgi:PhoD-like phosphatase, N-terminal domain
MRAPPGEAALTGRNVYHKDGNMILCSLRCSFLAVPILAALTAGLRAEVALDGIAAGDASSTDAVLWTRAENGGNPTELTAQVATDPDFENIVSTVDGAATTDTDFTLKLDVTGLTANTQYYYRFVMPGGVTSATGRFITAPTPDQKVEVRFGFSGDADGRFRPYPLIANLASQKLNYFIFLGDTMYETASTGSPAVPVITGLTTNTAELSTALTGYNRKYLENRLGVNTATGLPNNAGQQSLQPMFAAAGAYTLLDNHELGNLSLQSGGAPPTAPQQTTDLSFDVNATGSYNVKTAAFQTIEKSFLDPGGSHQHLQAEWAAGRRGFRSSQRRHAAALFRSAMGRQQYLYPGRRSQLSRHPAHQAQRQ